MSAYRLETFAPLSGPLRPRGDPVTRRIEAAREEAYRDGFLAGQAMATEEFLAEEDRLTAELVEAIADARVTNEAARRHVASLTPLHARSAFSRALRSPRFIHSVARSVA